MWGGGRLAWITCYVGCFCIGLFLGWFEYAEHIAFGPNSHRNSQTVVASRIRGNMPWSLLRYNREVHGEAGEWVSHRH